MLHTGYVLPDRQTKLGGPERCFACADTDMEKNKSISK